MTGKPIAAMVEKIAKECEEANADKWTIAKIAKQLAGEENLGINSAYIKKNSPRTRILLSAKVSGNRTPAIRAIIQWLEHCFFYKQNLK